MIVIYHNENGVTSVDATSSDIIQQITNRNLTDAVLEFAENYPDQIIVWCHDDCKSELNFDAIPQIINHNKSLASFHPTANFLPESLGYVDESTFLKVDKNVRFATWRMSETVGAVHASILNLDQIRKLPDKSFVYFLNSVAKLGMPNGLRCYSDPRFLKSEIARTANQASTAELFKFIGQHYKKTWIFLLLLNFAIYEKKYPIMAALRGLFYHRRRLSTNVLSNIHGSGKTEINLSKSIDVVIPTIGRESVLLDFLNDLKSQTLLPKRVIIVEQNPLPGSKSALNYIYERQWPFEIKHIFIHQSGVCNARNLALNELENDWVFLADDDIRIESDFLERIFAQIYDNGNEVYNVCCLQKGQKPEIEIDHQTTIFGSGCSIVSKRSIGNSKFNMAFEFGFGEDGDFGCQLMKKGHSVEYLPKPIILHLKAPVGGFRTKHVHEWEADEVWPKPSPTVMLFRMLHTTPQQLNGYKTILFFKFYALQSIKNPFKYYRTMQTKWDRSVYWAQWLMTNRK